MRKLVVAAAIAIYFMSISAFAQVRPSLTSNNHPPQATSVLPSSSSRTGTESINLELTGQSWDIAALASVMERPDQPPAKSAEKDFLRLTQTYKVGVGDILDIQIAGTSTSNSTLYTVMPGGSLDYPLAGKVISVAGLTPEAIATTLRATIKVLDQPHVIVKVRDYASHPVNVIGFVQAPGARVLRREAVPLYVVLSQSVPLPDAMTATIVRNGRVVFEGNLRSGEATNQLIVSGDVIKISDKQLMENW